MVTALAAKARERPAFWRAAALAEIVVIVLPRPLLLILLRTEAGAWKAPPRTRGLRRLAVPFVVGIHGYFLTAFQSALYVAPISAY